MRQTTGIILLESLTGFVLLIALGLGLVAWRLVSGPTDLGFVKAEVETALTDARGGKPATIDSLSLRWQSQTNEFEVFAEGLVFYDDVGGDVVARSDSARMDLHGVGLLAGNIRLQEIQIRGGELTVRRDLDGAIWIAGEKIPAVYPLHFHERVSMVQYIEQSLLNIVQNISDSPALEDLRAVGLEEIDIHVLAEYFEVDWWLEDGDVSLTKDNDTIEIAGSGDAVGEGAPDFVDFSLTFEPEIRSIQSVLHLTGIQPLETAFVQRIAPGIDGYVNTDLTFTFVLEQFGIERLSLDVVTQPGEIDLAGQLITFDINDIGLSYILNSDEFELQGRELNVGPVSAQLEGVIQNATALIEDPFENDFGLDINADTLTIDARSVFPDIWNLADVSLVGVVDPADQSLTFSSLDLGVDDVDVSSQGVIYAAFDSPDAKLPFGVDLTAQTSGIVSPEQVLRFWPESLGTGARNWVAENVRAGEMSDAQLSLNLPPGALNRGYLEDEHLQLDFSFENAEVAFLSDLPSIQNGSGSARLRGNSFTLDLQRAGFSNWVLNRGTVEIPRFMPKGENLVIDARGRGDVQDLVRTLSDSRLQLEAQYGLKVDDISGTGVARFHLERPALSDVSYEDTKFRATGTVSDGAFLNIFEDMSLTEGEARVLVDNDTLSVAGYGQFSDAPVEFSWTDKFRSDAPDRTELTASGYVSPDLLNQFGIAVRTYLTGDAYASLRAVGPAADTFDVMDVELDLSNSRLDVPELNWIKPRDEAASAIIRYVTNDIDQTTSVRFSAEGVEFQGEVELNPEGNLHRLDLNRLFLEDEIDVGGRIERLDAETLNVVLGGAYLNAEPLLEGVLGSGAGGGSIPLFGSVTFDLSVDELRLRDDMIIRGANLDAVFLGPRLNDLTLSGAINGLDQLDLEIAAAGENERSLTATVQNAGTLLEGVLGIGFLRGGDLRVTGLMRAEGEPTDMTLNVRNARLTEAPLLTQILSLASLRGLADVMSGEGILLSEINIPLVIDGRGYYIQGAKASGPALGMTAKGHILDDGSTLSIDGVLVPSFGMNSALGGIPIFGDLFVSREGEGVFAMTYAVRGSLESARVSVNPLSGILPGVLRRIFENPETEVVPVPEPSVEN